MWIPAPRLGANCWVVDGNHGLFDALTWADQLDNRTVKVFSVEDLVTACAKSAIKLSKPIEFLAVFGHGTRGYQSVGAGKHYEQTGRKSLLYTGIVVPPRTSHLIGPAESNIAGLNGVLSPDATILLAGCNVGEGGEGTGLLTTLSKILGNRRVQAFENAVYWWTGHLLGPLKEARGSNVSSSMSEYTVVPS